MERTIGNLGEEIRQPSNPYANLSQRGLLRCQVNALMAMIPDPRSSTPFSTSRAVDLGQGYVLLRAQDRYDRLMRPQEAGAFLHYLRRAAAEGSSESIDCNWCPKVTRWARLQPSKMVRWPDLAGRSPSNPWESFALLVMSRWDICQSNRFTHLLTRDILI